MRVAVLDLGTNTFNLVVAENTGGHAFRILHSSKIPVKLGEGGINRGVIVQDAFDRGVNAVITHYKHIQTYKVEKVFAFGTSALRTAKNGSLFLSSIKAVTGIDIEIITGDREAELIYYGVRQTHPMNPGIYLILDIGGGSNEFIIADRHEIYWKKSYDLGIARLLERFNPSNPIHPEEINRINKFLDREIPVLKEKVTEYRVQTLLGASGSFETFVAMIHASEEMTETQVALSPKAIPVSNAEFDSLYQTLIHSTRAERLKMKGLEPMRVEMIVLACLFTKFIIEKLGIKTIIQSNFALKEGAIYQLFNTDSHGPHSGNR
jgi:exopolyphosphatase/guanosine-5'-triphosphate,3'-diphosphate pyrophosphatase